MKLASLLSILLLTCTSVKASEIDVIQNALEKDLIDSALDLSVSNLTNNEGACSVVSRVTAPGSDGQGVAWDSGKLWVSDDDYNYPRIYQTSTYGSMLSSFGAPGDGPMGLALANGSLWNVDFLDDTIWRLSRSGSVQGAIPAPSGISSGLAWDGNNFWVSEWYDERIYKISSSGSILKTLSAPSPEEEPYGLAFDGRDLWVSDSDGIHRIDPQTSQVINRCTDSDFRYGKAYGLTWDGTYLWGVSWISNEMIKISVPPPRIPPPPQPGDIFYDVPLSHWAHDAISEIYHQGVTGGCATNPLQYCPDASVTRAEMAVFLIRSLGETPVTPTGLFRDVNHQYWAAAHIERLSQLGITGGCGNGNYCPEAQVTRAEMAVFLLKSRYGGSYFPSSYIGRFTDVPRDYWSALWIEQLAADTITGGCTATKFCPEGKVTRAQMAVFLSRTFRDFWN